MLGGQPALGRLSVQLLAPAALLLAFSKASCRQQLVQLHARHAFLLSMLILSFVLSTFVNPYRYGGWLQTQLLVAQVCVFLVAFSAPARDRRTLVHVVLAGGLLAVGYAVVEAVFGSTGGFYRISSYFYLYSHFAMLMGLLLPLSLVLWVNTAKRRYSVLAGVFAVSLALTLSWDSLLITALVTGGYLLVKARRLLTIGLLGLALVASATLVARPLDVGYSPQQFGSFLSAKLSGRAELYKGSLNIIAAKPLLGAGPGNFITAYQQYRPAPRLKYPFLMRLVNHAHSDYLQLGATVGLLGLAGYCLFWLSLIAVGGSYNPAILCVLLLGLLDAPVTVVPAVSVSVWLLAGLSLADARNTS